MEFTALLKHIKKRWREDENSDFYGMTDREISAELKRRSAQWEVAQG